METATLTRQDIPTAPQMSSAWIAPNGDFYYVRNAQHNYCAALINGHDPEDAWCDDELLDARGWVHLSGKDIWVRGGRVTQAQRDTLWDVARLYHDAGHLGRYSALTAQLEELE